MIEGLRASGAARGRSLRAVWRRPVVLSFSLAQPLWWMALFGFLFERVVDPAALGAADYLSFVAPGVSLMTVLFGASQSGVPLVRDAQTGVLARSLGARAPAAAWLFGKLQGDVLRFVIGAGGVLALAWALGAQLQPDLTALPAALLTCAAFAVAMASLSCTVAALTRAPEVLGTYVHLINMPLLFTSTTLVPDRSLPDWLASLARFNPLSVAVQHWRAAWLGLPVESGAGLWALLALAVLCFALACTALGGARLRC